MNGSVLIAINALGSALWAHRFPSRVAPIEGEELAWRVQVVDLVGNGRPGVLTALTLSAEDGSRWDELVYFLADGRVAWYARIRPDLLDGHGQLFEDAWRIRHVIVVPEGSARSVWVAVINAERFAGCILRIDADGNARVHFANPGFVERLCFVATAAKKWIVASGENNAYDLPFAVIFPADSPPLSPLPAGPARYRYANAPSGRPTKYVLFPRGELMLAQDRSYGIARDIRRISGAIIVTVELDVSAGWLFTFSDVFEPKVVAPSSDVYRLHWRLEKSGRLRHSWKGCPETAVPATVKLWTPEYGWERRKVPWRLPTNSA